MSNVNNASIRYLMKEMDPSEELLMEREMLEDEDLLIEVESMRRTLQRLNRDLPLVDPPARITKGIIKQATVRDQATPETARVFSLYRHQYAAAAAVVVIGLLGGLVWLQADSTESSGPSQQGNSPSVSSTTAPSTFSSSASDINTTPPSSSTASSDPEVTPAVDAERGAGVEPWIDRNEVMSVQDQFAEENRAAYDSILFNSTRKLTPINEDPLQNSTYNRSLQLTGSETD